MNFGSVLTAMVTPFDQNGELDLNAAEVLVNHLISNGSDGLVIGGTTGESPTLSHEEKLQLFNFVVKVVNNRVPVIAGTGSNNTKASVELTREAEVSGVDGIMLVTPYYNKPSQEGMYQHFKMIAESTSLPVMLYNIPGRSVVNLEPETIIRLSNIKNIVSVKESSGDLDAAAEIISNTPDNFTVYSGDDSNALPLMAIGGSGVVSVAAHIIGNELKDMTSALLRGDVVYAGALHRQLLPMMKVLFSAPNPTPVKAALHRLGVPAGDVRLPLIPLNDTERAVLYKVMEGYESKKVAGY